MGIINNQDEENTKLAKEMLTLGIDIEQICQITKLTKEEVEKLAKES